MNFLTPQKTKKLEEAVVDGSLTTVKHILKNVKKVPGGLIKTANAAFSNARKAGESNYNLQRRQEIENALKKKEGFVGKITNFFGLNGGKNTRKLRRKRGKNTRKH